MTLPDNNAHEVAGEAKQWCKKQGVAPVRICGIDAGKQLLKAESGVLFYEVATNLWAPLDHCAPPVVYLGTGRHQGGLVLRPLYVNFGNGWRNVSTGQLAPAGMLDSVADDYANSISKQGKHFAQ